MPKKIEPSYHLLESKDCHLIYSTSNHLSMQSNYYQFSAEKVKKRFGFDLACEDLAKSYSSATKYIVDNNLKEYVLPVEFKTFISNSMDVLVVHKLSKTMGYGVSSGSTIEKGTIVAEYIGKKISAFSRSNDTTYVYLTDDHTYVDSKNYGNVARFINHCPHNHTDETVMTANLAAVKLPMSKYLNTIFFITLRDINQFEPLCFDYGNKYDHDGIELLSAETYLPIPEL